MADIILGEVGDGVWLVQGEAHIDDMFADTLPAAVTIAFVRYESRDALLAVWAADEGRLSDAGDPWQIHPGLARRIRGTLGPLGIAFSPWSAMLDPRATENVESTARWMAANPAARLTIRQFLAADPAAGLADMQRLRGQLVAGALARAGVAPDRLDQETQAGDDADRVAFVTRDLPEG